MKPVQPKTNKVVIISAPSGAGKTTIVHYLLDQFEREMMFSISACNRKQRNGEINGKDYYFLNTEDFIKKIENDEFVEWEEVYQNNFYGTLKSEFERIWKLNKNVIVEVDVKGALSIKKLYPDNSLCIFVNIPSLSILKKRLIERGTESKSSLERRLRKAAYELSFANKFDKVIINDELEKTKSQAKDIIKEFLKS